MDGPKHRRMPKSGAEAYEALRTTALHIAPDVVGLKADPAQSVPYGILMEMGREKAVVTLVSFISGDASMYFSTGGGVIGGVGHENVKSAAAAFVRSSAPFIERMEPVDTFPKPAIGTVRFYVLTTKGIRTAEFRDDDLGNGRSDFTPLFIKGHEVIGQLRILMERQEK